jgi:transposase
LIGMEACSGAHYWAKRFRAFGHEVRLMSPQFVKPYVKSNKNDFLDAEAICEAVARPNMRFVPVKSDEQLELQQLHRARSLAVSQRTALANQIRGFLQEYGIAVAQGLPQLREQLPSILEDAEIPMTDGARALLARLWHELRHTDEHIYYFDRTLQLIARKDPAARRLQSVPGIGPLAATALIAAVGNGENFNNARELAAWLGLVPRQHSTGGRTRLLGISKRGDSYLRVLLIHGARAALRFVDRKSDARSRWATAVKARRGTNVAAVALANKNARTVWALLTRKEVYHPC